MFRSGAHARGGLGHPPTVLLLALAVAVAITLFPATRISVPMLGRVVGLGLIGVGVGLNVVGADTFDRRGTSIRPGSDPMSLVTDGVFRWTRNPMYLGMTAILGGSALALGSPWALLPLPVFVGWVSRLIRWEEALLEQTFGDAYRTYRKGVRRWL